MVAMVNYLVASLSWDLTTKMDVTLIERGNLWQSENRLFICGMNLTKNLVQNYSDHFGNSQRSSPSPTGCVKSTSPVTENHYKNGYENCTYSNNINTSNEDNNYDTNYINKHTDANHDTRKLHEWARHVERAVSVCLDDCHTHLIGSSSLSLHLIRMSCMCDSPWSHLLLFLLRPDLPRLLPLLSWCTLTCTPTSTTWTPWKTTFATPRRGALTPMTSPSPSQHRNQRTPVIFFHREFCRSVPSRSWWSWWCRRSSPDEIDRCRHHSAALLVTVGLAPFNFWFFSAPCVFFGGR